MCKRVLPEKIVVGTALLWLAYVHGSGRCSSVQTNLANSDLVASHYGGLKGSSNEPKEYKYYEVQCFSNGVYLEGDDKVKSKINKGALVGLENFILKNL